MTDHDNTADQQQTEGDIFAGLGEGGVDNDAYGQDNDKPQTTESGNDTDDSNDSDDDEGHEREKTQPKPEDEEEEFYWDGAPLASPTSKEEDGDASDTPLIKQLRQTIKDQRSQLRDKGLTPPTVANQAPAQAEQLPAFPKMEDEGIDYDPDIYQQKVREWYETEGRVKAQQQQQEASQQKIVTTFNERKAAYKDRVSSMKIRGYEDAEAFVAGEISQEIQTALILHSEKPELIVLALARNPELMKQAKDITDPVKLGMLIGTVEAKAKALPKGKSAVNGVPANPRGNGRSQVRDLDGEIEKARNSGDYTRVMQLKRQQTAAAKK